MPEEGSAPRPQGSLLLPFRPLGNPSSTTRHPGRVTRGSPGSHLRLSLPAPAVLLVTSRGSHCTTPSCRAAAAGWRQRLMNKSIPLGAEAAKLGCERRSSAGAGGRGGTACEFPPCSRRRRSCCCCCSQVGSSDCLLHMFYLSKRSICSSLLLSHISPRFSRLEMGAGFAEEPWGSAGSSWARGAVVPSPPCHTAVTSCHRAEDRGALL